MQRDAERTRALTPRRLACARCGVAFDCTLGGTCWCSAEPYRLPMSDAGAADCLCPACLRAAREGVAQAQDGSR